MWLIKVLFLSQNSNHYIIIFYSTLNLILITLLDLTWISLVLIQKRLRLIGIITVTRELLLSIKITVQQDWFNCVNWVNWVDFKKKIYNVWDKRTKAGKRQVTVFNWDIYIN